MRRATGLAGLALLALGACSTGPREVAREVAVDGTPTSYRSLAAPDAKVDIVAARDMISQYRVNHGLGAVVLDPALEGAALSQSRAMASANLLSHEVRGGLEARLAGAGIATGTAVENVSAGYHTLAEAFSGWRQSAPHNRNMLDKNVRRMGIATAYAPGTRYKVFWTLVMAD